MCPEITTSKKWPEVLCTGIFDAFFLATMKTIRTVSIMIEEEPNH